MAGAGPDRDRAHLARALAIAEAARPGSSPNPPVGCVLVRDGEVVAEGATGAPGQPHAEARALAVAGSAARGATAYVTLEPCDHHGRTAPCAAALVEAGVRRVVFGLEDVHPVAAGGAARLRAAGVEVSGGLLAPWVGAQLEGFVTATRQGRPHVTCKLAQTVDGRMSVRGEATVTGAGWITGPSARRAVHRWRAAVDAVLVGSGTVLADDPRLDVRHVAHRGRQPRPVVLDGRLRTPSTARVARGGALVVTAPGADPTARRALERAGVEVREVARGRGGGGADGAVNLDLAAALAVLVEAGITTVLAEPGPTLAGALVAAGLVDRLVLHVAPGTGDGPLRAAVDGPLTPVRVPGDAPTRVGPGWGLERLGGAGGDVVVHLVRRPSEGAAAGVPPVTAAEEG